MFTPTNKMQPQPMRSAESQSAICPVCRGTKTVEGRNGVALTCHACRGTGQAQGYQTK